MKYLQVEGSSLIDAIGYDEAQNILAVNFLEGGKYWYFNVPETDYILFADAESKGGHYNSHIKGKFLSGRMTDYNQDIEFDAILIANGRKVGTPNYRRFSQLCEDFGWEFIDAWDNSLFRQEWLATQDDGYKAQVKERVEYWTTELVSRQLGF